MSTEAGITSLVVRFLRPIAGLNIKFLTLFDSFVSINTYSNTLQFQQIR